MVNEKQLKSGTKIYKRYWYKDILFCIIDEICKKNIYVYENGKRKRYQKDIFLSLIPNPFYL